MIFYEQPTDPWIPYDFKLLEAYQILQDETCGQCGQPIWICDDSGGNTYFAVQSRICQGTAELEKRQTKREKANKKLAPGESEYVVPKRIDDSVPWPTRMGYYAAMQQS